MSTTANLAITKLEVGQAQKETTINEAFDALDSAIAGYTSRSVAGGSNVTLTAAQARAGVIELTGLLTANITVDLPAIATTGSSRRILVYNNTTGAYTVTVRYNGGTGVTIPQGMAQEVYHNGTNIYAAAPPFTPVTNAASSAWTAVTFSGTWVNYGAPFQNVQYRKIGDRVELRGTAKLGTALTTVFTLPAGYRPPADLAFPATCNAAFGAVIVTSAGAVSQAVGSNASISFDGMSFSVTT